MKKYLFILSFLSLVLFIDYVVIIITASIFSFSGIEIHFFQETYKTIGFAFVGTSFIAAGFYLYNLLPKLPAIH